MTFLRSHLYVFLAGWLLGTLLTTYIVARDYWQIEQASTSIRAEVRQIVEACFEQ